MLRIHCLGAVRAQVDGEPVDLGGRRQRSVLAVLVAAGGRTVSTDRFLDEVWEGEPPPSATGALQAYVSRLRSALEPTRRPRDPARVLVSAAPGYALRLPVEAVDVWALPDAVRRAAGLPDEVALGVLGAALRGWTGDPYAEYADEEWAAPEVVRLTEVHAEAVELHAGAALRTGRAAEVVADLESHVRRHPLREHGVGLLARALYATGRQADALDAIGTLRRRLADELGLDPAPTTRELEADVLQHAAHLHVPARSAPAPAVAAAVGAPDRPRRALLGRGGELDRLSDAATQVLRNGRPGVVWVDGEAGVGKSALLDAFCEQARDSRTWTVVVSRCPEVDGAPPGVEWREVLSALGAAPAPGATAFELAEAVPAALGDGPVLVALEDVHRADETGLQVLRHVVRTVDGPLLVVATHRAHEGGRDLAGTQAVTADRTLDRVHVRGLADRDARRLLAGHLPGELPDRVWRRLVDRAGGNPLFLRELGRLVAAEGDEAAERLPAGVRDLLRRRTERLAPGTVDLLSRAALLGVEVDLDVLVALEEEWSGATEDVVADHLDAGVVAGLLEGDATRGLRFSHALVRDTFHDLLAPLRRHRLHRTALQVLRRVRPDAVEDRARHAAASLDRRSARDALPDLLAAADRAGGSGATAAHLREALRALDLAGADPAERLPVRLALVGALARSGDTLAARAAREVAVAEARAHGDVRDLARAWAWPAPTLWARRAAEAPFEAVVAEIEDLLVRLGPGDDALRVELLCALVLECDPGGTERIGPAAEEALRLAERVDDPELVCRALNAGYLGTFAHGVDHLPAVAHRLVAVARGAGLLAYEAAGHLMLQSVAVGAGDLAAARAHAADALAVSTQGQLGELLLVDAVLGATGAVLDGRVDEARATFEEVCRAITASGDPNGEQIELWARFSVEWVAGSTAVLLDRVQAMARRLPVEVNDLLACALLDAGQVESAREVWHPVEWPRDGTWQFRSAVRASVAVRLGDLAVCRRLRAELGPWSGQLVRTLNGALVLGPVDDVLAALDDALDAARPAPNGPRAAR